MRSRQRNKEREGGRGRTVEHAQFMGKTASSPTMRAVDEKPSTWKKLRPITIGLAISALAGWLCTVVFSCSSIGSGSVIAVVQGDLYYSGGPPSRFGNSP